MIRSHPAARFALATFALAASVVGRPHPVAAQLPTAPAADRASNGGTTSAAPSLPGPYGNPLEPYLITWLLPVGGLLAAAACVGADRATRSRARISRVPR